MATWPQVAATAGAHAMLAALSKRFRLVVATNATDSRAAQVRAALARVQMGEYFSAIFTAAELGSRKPEPLFFFNLQSVLGASPDNLLMVGDDYRVDILGAKIAGWHAAWYNPRSIIAPALLPMQDAEFDHWDDFAGLLDRPLIPGYAQCRTWILAQPVSANLLAHVHAVASAAYVLAHWLRAAGHPVDPILAHRGGLLHDIGKIKAIQHPAEQHVSHAELAALILADLNQPVLAEIARRHPLFALRQPDSTPRSWEEKLVYFADKLVEGGRVAGIETRIASLRKRIPHDEEQIASLTPALLALQEEFSLAAGIPSHELIARLKTAFQKG